MRIKDAEAPSGWRWQRVPEYIQNVPASAYMRCSWPRNPERQVWVHVVTTSVKRLYRAQVIVIREHLDDPTDSARVWASSDLKADVQQLLVHVASRWQIEVFFEDMKELFGIDQYQVMSTQALLRSWSLCWIAFSFLEAHRHRLQTQWSRHVTLGEAKRDVQCTHHRLFVQWITECVHQGKSSEHITALLVA